MASGTVYEAPRQRERRRACPARLRKQARSHKIRGRNQAWAGHLSDDRLLLFDVQGALELRREVLGGGRVRVLFAAIEAVPLALFSAP